MDTPRIEIALALAEGVAHGDPSVGALVVAGFADVGEAATAHAYLTGFMLTLLAAARSEDLASAASYVRLMLRKSDEGRGSL